MRYSFTTTAAGTMRRRSFGVLSVGETRRACGDQGRVGRVEQVGQVGR
jgi:hypothetical protein